MEDSALVAVHRQLRQLERRDWWLWCTAIVVLLLVTLALVLVGVPLARHAIDALEEHIAYVAMRGLVGVVLLFTLYAIDQQRLIRGLRTRLGEQAQTTARLEVRAAEFEQLAVRDPLSGLLNRRALSEHLQNEMARARRMDYRLVVAAFDLNGFKQINDTYGHAAGDEAVREFALQLKETVRASDLAFRVGGDEFLALLPNCDAAHVESMVERLRRHFASPDRTLHLKFSVGCSEYVPGETPETFTERADRALYRDKEAHAVAATETVEA